MSPQCAARKREAGLGVWRPPRIRGLSSSRRIEVEQCLARTGSVAATMTATETSYETVHAIMEWMAA